MYSSSSSEIPYFVDAAWARELKPSLAHAPRPVRIISPCAGLGSQERAARELGMQWVTVGDYDVCAGLRLALEAISSDTSRLFTGRSGNVLEVPLSSLDLSADGLIAGPPCPPFSTIGKRMVETCQLTPLLF